jgi:hypothetical protein
MLPAAAGSCALVELPVVAAMTQPQRGASPPLDAAERSAGLAQSMPPAAVPRDAESSRPAAASRGAESSLPAAASRGAESSMLRAAEESLALVALPVVAAVEAQAPAEPRSGARVWAQRSVMGGPLMAPAPPGCVTVCLATGYEGPQPAATAMRVLLQAEAAKARVSCSSPPARTHLPCSIPDLA